MFIISYYINVERKKFSKKYLQTQNLFQQFQLPHVKDLSKDKIFMNKNLKHTPKKNLMKSRSVQLYLKKGYKNLKMFTKPSQKHNM